MALICDSFVKFRATFMHLKVCIEHIIFAKYVVINGL
jgi:hypothetical protein